LCFADYFKNINAYAGGGFGVIQLFLGLLAILLTIPSIIMLFILRSIVNPKKFWSIFGIVISLIIAFPILYFYFEVIGTALQLF
jgi:hypothetical protein